MILDVSPAAYDAARHRASFVDRSDRGRIVVSGTERASYLQGLLTNDIVALKAGRGCYTAYLTAQGRMIADLYAYELGDVLLLTMSGGVKDSVMAKLDQFIFSEDVQLGDVTDTFAQIAVVGPDAAVKVASIVSGVPEAALRGMPEHGNARGEWAGGAAIVTRIADTGEPGFDLFVERAQAGALKTALMAAGVNELDTGTAEAVRVESGVPVFGRDMDEDTIPLEAGIEARAISFSKGCYVGQEVIIRVLHRGHGRVARKLVGLALDSEPVPEAGAIVRSGDREIGRVTSSTASPALKRPIALAYVQRDFVEPGTTVTVGDQNATVTALPFVTPLQAFRPA
jgi:folate-binding protein YgfZ